MAKTRTTTTTEPTGTMKPASAHIPTVLRLASERRDLWTAAREAVIAQANGDLGATGQDIVDDLLNALNFPTAEKRNDFVRQSKEIGRLRFVAGTQADREAAGAKLTAAGQAARDEQKGLPALRSQLAALEAKCAELTRAADEAQGELMLRLQAVEKLTAIAEADPVVGEEYRTALAKMSFPDALERPRVEALEALVVVTNRDSAKLHAEALLKSEDPALEAWGKRLLRVVPDGRGYIVQFNTTIWPEYIRERAVELAELRPRVEAAEKARAAEIARLRRELLDGFLMPD